VRRLLDALTVTDAQGTRYPPSVMWRKTAVLVAGSIALVGAVFVIGAIWEAFQ